MVVYNYPEIGAMTVIKDKTTGDKHWIIVDVYTFDVVQDKSTTGTEPEVFSIYEQKSKNGINENLKGWNESNQLTDFIKQEATNMGIDISVPITKENMIKLSEDVAIKSTTTSKTLNVPLSGQGTSATVSPSSITTTVTLSVPLYGQQNSYYCVPASGQMNAAYYGKSQTQSYIMGIMGGGTSGCTDSQELKYYKVSNGLAKTGSM